MTGTVPPSTVVPVGPHTTVLDALHWKRVEVVNPPAAPSIVLRQSKPRHEHRKPKHKQHRREQPVKIDPNSLFASLAVLVNKR